MGLLIHVDGGARGNPGPAGAGITICNEHGTRIFEAAYYLGRQTNNAAEYHALLRALQRAAAFPPQDITIFSDSELLVRQLTGAYQVKSPTLRPLHEQVQILLLKIQHWSIQHVRRDQNRRADELANLAMDRESDVVVFDAAHAATGGNGPTREPVSDAVAAATTPRQAAPVVEPGGPPAAPGGARRAVRVQCTRTPGAGQCPAPDGFADLLIAERLPGGLCIHAAHALLPTAIAMLNTEPAEFGAVPVMTVRCARPGCRAEFKLSPVVHDAGRTRA